MKKHLQQHRLTSAAACARPDKGASQAYGKTVVHAVLPVVLLVLSQGLMAQQLPGAGSQIQQLPQAPALPKAQPEIRIQESGSPGKPASSTATILVNKLQITGSRVFSEAELLALTGFVPGQMTLGDLQAMAGRITDHYRKNGYFVARAYLPAQSVKDNAITIAVSEGTYGKIVIRNESRLSDALVRNILEGVNTGDAITNDTLESRLLLLSDIAGVKVKSTLAPGDAPGSSDLIVDITPGATVSGSIDADNAGNRYTGEYRVGATVNLNNLAGQGDVLSVRGVTSGKGLNYGRISYQMQFGKATAGIAYSRLEYELGKEFAALKAHGTAEVATLYGIYPLIRSRDTNLNAGLNLDYRTFQDKVDVIPSVVDKDAKVAVASLYGNHRDNIGGGGANAFSLSLSLGNLNIKTPSALAADAVSARTNGSYGKLAFAASRLQRVTEDVSIYAGITGQLASKKLDSSEKMVLGGMDGVRAYPQGEAFGDQGYLVNVEARLLLPKPESLPGNVHLIGFVDAGSVTINKNPWAAGNNKRNLASYGVGLTWSEPGNFMVRTYYARKIGTEPAVSSPDKSGRFWIQAVKYF